jgi:two-component system, cell cycle response regulator DivK
MRMFSALIDAQGYIVLEAQDGYTGLALAQQHHPDLIVMDWMLPGIAGQHLARALRGDERTRSIPIIITTAFAASADNPDIRDAGCDGFLAKPIAVSAFLTMIDTFLAPQAT